MDTDRERDQTDTEGRLGLTSRHLAVACVLLGSAATLSWVIAAWLMTTRGFDITDEGFYVLSYRWWSSNLHSFTGAQYIYGPIFDALGHNVAALRIFRLGSVLGISMVFATTFMNWFAVNEPRARSLQWRLAGISLITASGGMIYAWLPQTPGYDDVAALGGLATASVVLSTARRWLVDRHIPVWLPVLGGSLCALQLLAKWSSVLSIIVFGLAIVLIVREHGWRSPTRYGALALAGAVGTTALIQIFVIPLNRALPEMWFVTGSAIDESGSLGGRAIQYLSEFLTITEHALVVGFPVIFVAVASRITRSRQLGLAWAAAIVAGFGLFFAFVAITQGWRGGHSNTFAYSITLFALVLASVLSSAGVGRPSATEIGPLIMLVLLPMTQAVGTSNPLWLVGANAFAAWFAIMVWLAATSRARLVPGLVSWLAAMSVVALVPVIVCTGLLAHPYRTTAFAADTAAAPGLTSIRVSPTTAREFEGLRDALRPYLRPGHTPIFALDRMSGLIFAVGGAAAGEPWTGVDGRLRSAAVFKRACEQGEVGPANPPILLYNRSPAAPDSDALASCGFVFSRDFREIHPAYGPPGVRVFVPR
jgi:hypothetical protein